jgi:hypothetical protein
MRGARPRRADFRWRSGPSLWVEPKHRIPLGEPPRKPLKHRLFYLDSHPNQKKI